ncbi:gluconokinase [Paenibacillus sp. GCM10027626]|uniref:gluconokinase n=1 Tax=Paenibacillus sp. GCM10027626 TaxID=3273411 RepID=UPI003637D34C
MMKDRTVIAAVDIGTTSVKVLAIDADALLEPAAGRRAVLLRVEKGYPLNEVKPGHFEQDPDYIAECAEQALRELNAQINDGEGELLAISFSSAMHSLIAVDADGLRLTGCITWADLRAAKYASLLRKSGEAAAIAARTGVPVHAMTPLCKLMWMREQEPDIHQKAAAFIGIREYVLHRWCGGPYVMDRSVAGGTGLYQLEQERWDEESLALAAVNESRLPQLVSATHIMNEMKPQAMRALGLKAAVPVIVGGADGVLANVGAGAIDRGVAAVTVGTSGAVRVAVLQPAGDKKGELFCYPLIDGLWFAGGAVNSGGVILRWLCEKFAPADAAAAKQQGADPYERLIGLAMETPAGAGGLLFLPHLAGERAPHWDEDARGSFVGLSLAHDRRHMLRAGLEGIVYGLRAVAESMAAAAGGPLREIRASGGFARSSALRQLMADIFGCPVTLADTQEASAIGASMLALLALGKAQSLRGLAAQVSAADRCEPRPEASAVYDRLWPVYRSLYGALAPAYRELAAFQREH